jgi:uncharacterized membrane protein YeaQ/YmgE (transglycosylase-associated protein family)
MNSFVWLTLGVVSGYLGSLIMRPEPERGAVLGTAAGILGALLADWLLGPVFAGSPDHGYFSASAVALSLLGSVLLVGFVNYLRLGRVR